MDFGIAVQALADGGVDFVIIGGVSAMLHGSAYYTRDLDVCYSRSAANVEKLAAALAPFHPRPRGFPKDLPFVWDKATVRNATVLTLQTDLGDVDLLAEVAGVGTFEEAKAHSCLVDAFERKVYNLDLRSLISAKRAAGRPKDLSLVAELEALLEATESEPS